MSKYFITFSNKDYISTERIINQANELNCFDFIKSYNEDDILDYITKHKEFIKKNTHGFGFWIWKPKIILDTLNIMKNNDVLVYCDAGMWINKNGKKRLNYYFSKLKEKDIITFSLNDYYKAQYYVKYSVVRRYYPEFILSLDNYCYGGVFIIKKTESSLKLINDWYDLCQNYNNLDKVPSMNDIMNKEYRGNDCDNGIFNLCLQKYKIDFKVYPDETNIYLKNGEQDYKCQDWSSLDNFPFQCRRIRPIQKD